jgi:hypothetical protein
MSKKIIGVTVGTNLNPKKIGGATTYENLGTEDKTLVGAINELAGSTIKSASAGDGLTAHIENNNIHIDFDDDVIFIFDGGNSTSYLTGYHLEDNAAGGTTAHIDTSESTYALEDNTAGGQTAIIE